LVGEEEMRGLEGVELEEGGGEVGKGGAAGGGGTACHEVAGEGGDGGEPFGIGWYELAVTGQRDLGNVGVRSKGG
jgi:hypothetical protein